MEVLELPQATVQEPVRKPGTFSKGDPRIRQNKAKAEAAKSQKERSEVEAARDPVLTAYRAVLANDAKFDVGGLEQTAREIRNENPRQFMDRYRELESAERASSVASGGFEDVGVGEALKMIERVLADASLETIEVES